MPKVSPVQESLNSGEFSPLMAARVRFQKYPNALETCFNALPIVQGGVTARPGTKYVAEVKSSAAATRLIPFEFSTTQAYVLEFGDHYMRVYKDHGQIQTSGVAAYSGATAYVIGDLVTNGGTTYYCIAATTGNAPPNATYWYAQTGTIYEIPTPYTTSDIPNLKFTQSADVLYIAHSSYAPRKLTRSGHTTWTLSIIDFLDGPYLPINATATTLTLSGTTGSVTVTASATTGINGGSGFVASDVGRRIRWKDPASNWTWLEITARTDSLNVTATIRGANASATTATANWRLGVWSATTGYPSCVTFFEDRLFWAGATSYPQRLDGSKTGDYENYAPSAADGTVAADNGIAVTLNASDVNVIRWMVDDEKGMLVGTVGGEWIVRPSTLSEALSPTNISAKRSTTHGSANVAPVRAGKAAVYVQRSGRKVRELAYVYEVDGFRSPDMTVLAEHVTMGGVTAIEYQQEPYSVLWFVRADGILVGLTYERDQDVIGWHRHQIGGVFGASGNAVVESIACIPNPTGTADELWMIVKRTINSGTERYIEYLTPFWDSSMEQEDAFFVDCGLTYDGAAATTISGLDHLEGQEVAILADGASHPNKTVSSGSITLDRSASVVQVGLPYNKDVKTLRIEAGAADGTAQGKTKRIHSVVFRFFETLGVKYGPDSANLSSITFRTSATPMGSAPDLFTGDIGLRFEGDYESEGQIFVRSYQPFPMTILAIMPQLHTQDDGQRKGR